MIRSRNLDPGQYPHPNHLIQGAAVDIANYWVAATTLNNTGAAVPAGFYLPLAATATRPIPMAQAIALSTAGGVASNGDTNLRISGLDQFGKPVYQDFLIPSGTASASLLMATATLITTRVFRKVTGVQVLSNANTAATTVAIGPVANNAQFKLGVPVKLARVTEAIRLITFAALAGTNVNLGTTATVDLTNHAIMPGAFVSTTNGGLLIIQLDLSQNTGQRG